MINILIEVKRINWNQSMLNDEEIRLNIMEILEERIDDNVEKSSKDEIT